MRVGPWTKDGIAWMAGLFEGDGCVLGARSGAGKKMRGRMLRVRIVMTDPDVLYRFQALACCGGVYGPHKPSGFGKKDRWTLTINGRAAYALLVAMFPYLLSRRRARIKEVIDSWREVTRHRKLTADDVRYILGVYANTPKGEHGPIRIKELAAKYNCSAGMISAIRTGRARTDVKL